MINTAEVYMWGTRIGIIHLPEDRPYLSFEYDRDFIRSGIELSPISMKLSNRVYEFPDLAETSFHGAPGLIVDSLPDRFGNAVISKWLVSQGRGERDFNIIDRLCYTGSRGMGALEYTPSSGPKIGESEAVDVDSMVRFASDILQDRANFNISTSDELAYEQLLQLGTSAGGARAKAVIAWNSKTNEIRSGQVEAGHGFEYYLIKFDGVIKNGDHALDDIPEYTLIEYAYYKMAVKAGINMTESRILSKNGRNHFMTKRFDRADGGKIHMQTLGAVAHIDYNVPDLCSYEQAVSYMRQMNLPASDIEQFYRRMVFNVLAVNQDDHVKNTSFLMDRTGKWRLSPAYDITFSYDTGNKWISAHQMTVNGKTSEISMHDLMQSGRNMDISSARCRRIINEVQGAVNGWHDIADSCGIKEKTFEMIDHVIKETKTKFLNGECAK
ncbi:MAG: type II toxin-antitoxin system HipA family toxin [Lachnospiraceae bacterium]|jgi:serine/threonine-protein kinase HipA|nr:type II toxin-antitoxin system HipA family toxin [Lachnospiraceae bacterium]